MPLVTRLRRTGFRKGVQGNRTWLALGVSLWGAQKLRALATRDAEVLVREELKPGERMIIANGRVTVDRVVDPLEPDDAGGGGTKKKRRRRSRRRS